MTIIVLDDNLINEAISEIVVDLIKHYRLIHGLLIPDALIAATALYLDKKLLILNY
jgi:predicted nucleic acid-binding protein